jgi:hypothetical protein
MLDASPEVERVRKLVGKRLFEVTRMESNQQALERMLLTLWRGGYVELDPHPPRGESDEEADSSATDDASIAESGKPKAGELTLGKSSGHVGLTPRRSPSSSLPHSPTPPLPDSSPPAYRPEFAYPTELLSRLMIFRSVNPLYGVFLVNQLGIADRTERVQAMESVLEVPGTVARLVRVPKHDVLPPGPLAVTRLDPHLLMLGLVTPEQLGAQPEEEEESDRRRGPRAFYEEDDRVWVLTLADKLRIQFDYDFPGVQDVHTQGVWAAGELLEFGDFNKYVTSKGLQKQEGILFRHLLRMILLVGEFTQLCPPDASEGEWRDDLRDIADRLTDICRFVDPTSTDETLEQVRRAAEGDLH